MEQTDATKPVETSKESMVPTLLSTARRTVLRWIAWPRRLGRIELLALGLAVLVPPISVIVFNRQYPHFDRPLFEGFFARPSANQSAVLAVDSHGMTIRGKNLSDAARGRFEQATVEHLARLQPIYAGWAATDEEAVGKLLLKLHVDAAGKVARIEPLQSRLSSGDFAKVVLEEMRAWNFSGASGQPAEITLPLLFVPKDLDASMVVQWERRSRGSGVVSKVAKPQPGSPPRDTARLAAAVENASRSGAQAGVAKRTVNPKPALPVVKTTRAVTLRQQPRFAAEQLQEIDAETELNLLERKGDWLKVRMADARAVGFVRKEYLTPVN
jgi:hypothetical protein